MAWKWITSLTVGALLLAGVVASFTSPEIRTQQANTASQNQDLEGLSTKPVISMSESKVGSFEKTYDYEPNPSNGQNRYGGEALHEYSSAAGIHDSKGISSIQSGSLSRDYSSELGNPLYDRTQRYPGIIDSESTFRAGSGSQSSSSPQIGLIGSGSSSGTSSNFGGSTTFHSGSVDGRPYYGTSSSFGGSTTFHSGSVDGRPYYGTSNNFGGSTTFHSGSVDGRPYSGTSSNFGGLTTFHSGSVDGRPYSGTSNNFGGSTTFHSGTIDGRSFSCTSSNFGGSITFTNCP